MFIIHFFQHLKPLVSGLWFVGGVSHCFSFTKGGLDRRQGCPNCGLWPWCGLSHWRSHHHFWQPGVVESLASTLLGGSHALSGNAKKMMAVMENAPGRGKVEDMQTDKSEIGDRSVQTTAEGVIHF